MKYKRISILGSCGAGKSVFAKRLSQQWAIPLYHLDQHYWQKGWVELDQGKWQELHSTLLEKDLWIIDGNYTSTIEKRIMASDMIFYLDIPSALCVGRVLTRSMLNYGKTREDMGEGCEERFSWEFLEYVLNFKRTRRPEILKSLDESGSKIIILRSDKEVDDFLRKHTSSYIF